MISIRSSADLARALADPLHPDLRRLLELRRDQLACDGTDIGAHTHIVVAQRGDTAAAIAAEAGVPVGRDHQYEWVRRHGAVLEAVTITDDEGFAVVVIAANCVTTDPALLVPMLVSA